MTATDDAFSEPMRYGMLGGDTSSAGEKLAKYTGEVDWEYLRPHYESGALFFVDPELSLETVGVALAANDTSKVEAWLQSGDLVKIETIHAIQWQEQAPIFEALVISPFVLCRPAR